MELHHMVPFNIGFDNEFLGRQNHKFQIWSQLKKFIYLDKKNVVLKIPFMETIHMQNFYFPGKSFLSNQK